MKFDYIFTQLYGDKKIEDITLPEKKDLEHLLVSIDLKIERWKSSERVDAWDNRFVGYLIFCTVFPVIPMALIVTAFVSTEIYSGEFMNEDPIQKALTVTLFLFLAYLAIRYVNKTYRADLKIETKQLNHFRRMRDFKKIIEQEIKKTKHKSVTS